MADEILKKRCLYANENLKNYLNICIAKETIRKHNNNLKRLQIFHSHNKIDLCKNNLFQTVNMNILFFNN